MSEATNRIIDLAFEDSLLQAGWLPCLINEQLVSSVESVQVGLFCENRASGESDTIVDGDEDVHWPEEEYLIASFPYRGKHSLMLGSWKVYRGLLHEILKRRLAPGAVLEVFDTNAEQIRYLMPVE
ncbi:MAG TPA: hypothetical protein ENH10_04375 [Bacteroidetes bacterium]|nr:hypothetical protein [Bacteroidota bacterium]HEX04375.1 hypothetical protein [Bacteroidota bacterium]